jgi:branched-chain amino acid transport system permease protein
MLGAFLGYEIFIRTGNFIAGLAIVSFLIAILGGLIEIGLLRKLSRQHTAQILATLGLLFLIDQLCWIIWGDVIYWWMPDLLAGTINLAGVILYKYRLFLIFLGLAVAGSVYLFLKYTKLGMVIRAGIDDTEMAKALGADVKLAFTIMFAIGCGLTGLGGAAIVPWLSASSTLGTNYLFYAFAIVVIGGVGSFKGSFFGSILVGIMEELCMYYAPWFAGASTFIVMLVVLLVKPEGLMKV